jgi:hypothetical protein
VIARESMRLRLTFGKESGPSWWKTADHEVAVGTFEPPQVVASLSGLQRRGGPHSGDSQPMHKIVDVGLCHRSNLLCG